jgi:hypothetical protein
MAGTARFPFWGKMERKKKNSKLGFVAGFLYGGSTRLVTLPRKEEAPARREGRHGVELAGMRTGEDEDDPLLSFFLKRKGTFGLVSGLLVGCWAGCCWAARICQVSPPFLLFSFLFLFPVFLFYFVFCFKFNSNYFIPRR